MKPRRDILATGSVARLRIVLASHEYPAKLAPPPVMPPQLLSLLGQALRYGIALAAIVLGVSLLYYFGPNQARRLRNVWPGAILATALWWATTAGFGWYVRNIANYNVMYGSIGAVIAMLVWMYLLAAIALVGCEYNAEREKLIATLRTMKRTPAR